MFCKSIKIGFCILVLLFFLFNNLVGQDTCYIKVHFLYGSKPKSQFKSTEKKWVGGLMGGHVGIEISKNKVVSFLPEGKLHIFPCRKHKHGRFKIQSVSDFYKELAIDLDSIKNTIIQIPITVDKQELLDRIAKEYVINTPYDYAFLGMRCSSACYDLLGRIGVLTTYPIFKIWYKIFYPKILRHKLLNMANKKLWSIERHEGTKRRTWEND
jgi:hypothetical protein